MTRLSRPEYPPVGDPRLWSRRRWLQSVSGGMGLIGVTGALQAAADQVPHHLARAKRVIFLFMNGAPSHVDTFDPKPELEKVAGQQPEGPGARKNRGTGYMPSPFQFAPRGESGVIMSELFPQLARHADELCVVRSMHTDVPNHEPALLLMHSGHQQPVRPSLGSWVTYGLGSENQNLPSYVVLCPGLPVVGPQLWSNAFLPGSFQGTSVDTNHQDVERLVANVRNPRWSAAQQRKQLDVLNELNRMHRDQREFDPLLQSQIKALELAFQMQTTAGEAFDVSRETRATQEAYGDSLFGRSCLLARRLCERGVRFVQVYYVDQKNKQPWDTHQDNDNRHRTLCADSDRASAALLQDLKQRGLLDDTLVIWSGEFGRTPYSQVDTKKKNAKPGRDHHHTGFSLWLAGGGVRGGQMYGTTDEFGMHAVENRVHVHDLHATILHLMGMDHERLTYRYSGRDFRLTDVHGKLVPIFDA